MTHRPEFRAGLLVLPALSGSSDGTGCPDRAVRAVTQRLDCRGRSAQSELAPQRSQEFAGVVDSAGSLLQGVEGRSGGIGVRGRKHD